MREEVPVMTSADAALAVALVGGRLVLEAGRVGLEAPAGSLGQLVLDALALHQEELARWLRAERAAELRDALNAMYRRLDRLGPWTAEQFNAHTELGDEFDIEARRYLGGDHAEPTVLYAALGRWEHALVEGKRGAAQ
jgi:hypothetical protein